jgi:hypothetical protein
MKKAFLILVSLLAIGSAFAQTKFPLKIVCNVMDADVYINNKLYTKTTANLIIQLPPSTYNIKVAKAGYNEFQANVAVQASNSGTILNVALQPLQAPAQVGTPNILPSFPLNIASNVSGAQVYLNGKPTGQTPFGQNVIGGTYEIRVTAPGYADFQQKVIVKGPLQVNAMLQPTGQMLSVQSNVQGADVIINGNPAGKTPFSAQVPSGSYNVTVKAPGYFDFNQGVVVGNGAAQVNAVLQPLGYQLSVSANVQGASVFVNNQQLGQTPFATTLAPGSYTLLVRASGYLDYQVQLSVNGPQVVNASLQPASASWQFRIPEAFLNKDQGKDQGKGKDQRSYAQAQLWIDGILQPEAPGQAFASGQLFPGRHVIRFVSGGLAVETQVDVQAGKAYVFEPFIGISVK